MIEDFIILIFGPHICFVLLMAFAFFCIGSIVTYFMKKVD